MHLTRFEINPERYGARRLMASPHRMHAAVLAAFPDESTDAVAGFDRDLESPSTGDEGRVLWRVDESRHGAVLYVVSPSKPDLTHLVETAGRPTYGWQTRDYGPFLDRLSLGDRWAFRLLANPVRNIRTRDGAHRGKRSAHVTVPQQLDWMLRQAERHGFTVPDGSANEKDLVVRSRHVRRFERENRTVTIAYSLFEGSLVVEDPGALRSALVGGIGPAKGYGCGLITLAALGQSV
jgi:CRISPR system Cascade subunit CasE